MLLGQQRGLVPNRISIEVGLRAFCELWQLLGLR